jgi:hypothetical protein
VKRQDLFWCIRSYITSSKSMQNTYSYQLIVEQEGLQPSGLYIHEQMQSFFLLPSYHHHLEQHNTKCWNLNLFLLLLPVRSVLKTECNYSVHFRTVQLKSVLFTVKNRVEHYLHLGLQKWSFILWT